MIVEAGPGDTEKMLGEILEGLRQEIFRSRSESFNYEQQRQHDVRELKETLASIQKKIRSSEVHAQPFLQTPMLGPAPITASQQFPVIDGIVGAGGGQDMEETRKQTVSHQVDVVHEIEDITDEHMKFWKELQEAVTHNTRVAYEKIIANHKESVWHQVFRHMKADHLIRKEVPPGILARITDSHLFLACQMSLILSNTAVTCYETDQTIRAALKDPPGVLPDWLDTCNLTFNMVFLVELIFRMFALRTWFFVAPQDWAWNLFDVVVVAASAINDVLGGVNLSFVRTFRLLRAVRALRLVRVLRFFSELRKILVAILACLASLVWCFVFLFVTIFLFSIVLLQGIAEDLNSMPRGSEEFARIRADASQKYGSVGDTIVALLAAVTAGEDYFSFTKPLTHAGFLYVTAYTVYLLFVTVGVMNVLTGVFLSSADAFADRHLVVQTEENEQARFVSAMTEVFDEEDIDCDGWLSWSELSGIMESPTVACYLQAYGLTVTHARLIFDMFDEHGQGKVRVHEFVMGILRLKGNSKAVDSRIIQRQITMLPELFSGLLKTSKTDLSQRSSPDWNEQEQVYQI